MTKYGQPLLSVNESQHTLSNILLRYLRDVTASNHFLMMPFSSVDDGF